MNNNKTEIAILLDRSGSMETICDDMEGAFKQFLKEQHDLLGECLVSLYQFDSEFDVVYTAKNIKEIQKLGLVPRGSTALYDSGCKAIDRFGEHLGETPEDARPANVIFVIITDGENNTGNLDPGQFRQKISHQSENYNWKFIYLGANQDSFAVGASLGINAGQVINYAPSALGTRGMSHAMSSNIASYRNAGCAVQDAVEFTAEQRVAASAGDANLLGKMPKSKTNLVGKI